MSCCWTLPWGLSPVCCNISVCAQETDFWDEPGTEIELLLLTPLLPTVGSKHAVDRRNQEAFKHSKPPSLCSSFSDPWDVTPVAPLPLSPHQLLTQNKIWKKILGKNIV